MPPISESEVRKIAGAVADPHTGRDLAASGSIRAVGVDDDRVSVDVELGYPAASWIGELASELRKALEAHPGVSLASVSVGSRVRAHRVQNNLSPLPGVRNIIAVASGKGGVGKSTVAANLALALVAEGASVGLLDADIHGPSQVRMLGLEGKPESPDGKRIVPKLSHGLQAMSIGLMVGEDTPMIWRGPMVTQALMQLLSDTSWEDLDYLVIDLPPGTGDIQLTLAQKVPVSGAVIVTTPQDIALIDAKKALKMFEKVSVPVLGVVENMASHVCSACGHEEHVFGQGGAERMSEQYGVPVLGSLPLDIRIREQADSGTPTVAAMAGSELAARYLQIARNAAGRLSCEERNKQIGFPQIVVQND